MSNNSTHSLDASHRIQEKYDFYFLALTFTIVGFAVQTQPNDTAFIGNIAELVSWLLFIISGIAGMFRIERRYLTFAVAYSKNIKGEEIKLYKKARSKGINEIEYLQGPPGKSTLPVREEVINGLREQMKELNSQIDKHQSYAKTLFYFQKTLFIGGLISLMVSRGIEPFLKIYSSF